MFGLNVHSLMLTPGFSGAAKPDLQPTGRMTKMAAGHSRRWGIFVLACGGQELIRMHAQPASGGARGDRGL
jgi:hypothetical protein